MYRFTEFVLIDHAAADVWAMLIDFPNVPAWEAGVREVRQTSAGQPTLGTTFVARRVFGGHETLIDCRIVAWESDRLVTMELKGGLVRHALVTYVVEPMGEGSCRVTYSTEGVMRPFLGLDNAVHPGDGQTAHSGQSDHPLWSARRSSDRRSFRGLSEPRGAPRLCHPIKPRATGDS